MPDNEERRDPFGPPRENTEVGCLHCGEVYESYQIEWREETDPTSTFDGHWCCPTPGCDACGFGFDILPTDPDYHDENGGWVHDDEEEFDEEWVEDDPLPPNDQPPPKLDDSGELPW